MLDYCVFLGLSEFLSRRGVGWERARENNGKSRKTESKDKAKKMSEKRKRKTGDTTW